MRELIYALRFQGEAQRIGPDGNILKAMTTAPGCTIVSRIAAVGLSGDVQPELGEEATLYKVDPTSGEFSLFAVVPDLTDLTGSTPTAVEQAQQPGPRQPVPTSLVVDPNGNIVVVLLSESRNGPSIITFAPDGTYTAGTTMLSMIVNAAWGPDGNLYVQTSRYDPPHMFARPVAKQHASSRGSGRTPVGLMADPDRRRFADRSGRA